MAIVPRFHAVSVVVVILLIALGLLADRQLRPAPPAGNTMPRTGQTAAAINRDTPGPNMALRQALLAELQPVTLRNCRPQRFGSAFDGGYAMCANLLDGIETAYSYGIGGQDDWGCQVSVARSVPVHQYDCFEPTRLACPGGDFRLNAECVGGRRQTIDGRQFDTLANQIARNGDTGRRMAVKMDVEGDEWQAILAAPDGVFASIVQMAMELHGMDDPEVLDGLRKLKRHFYLVSVHYNNWSCHPDWAPLESWAYQVLLVNKNTGVPGAPPSSWPTLASVLAPDNPKAPECR